MNATNTSLIAIAHWFPRDVMQRKYLCEASVFHVEELIVIIKLLGLRNNETGTEFGMRRWRYRNVDDGVGGCGYVAAITFVQRHLLATKSNAMMTLLIIG